MKRIDRDTLWYLIWSALTFVPKKDKVVADALNSRAALDRLCEHICSAVDNERFAIIDRGDSYMCKREPLPNNGDLVELRSLGPSVPPPVKM